MNTTAEDIETIIKLRERRDHAAKLLRQEESAQRFIQMLSLLIGVGLLTFVVYRWVTGQGIPHESVAGIGGSVVLSLLFRLLASHTVPAAEANLLRVERVLRNAQIADPRWGRVKVVLEMIQGSSVLGDDELASIEVLGDTIAEQLIQRSVLSGSDAVLLDAAIDERMALLEAIWQSSLRAGRVGEGAAAEGAARAVLARLQATAEVSTLC